MEEMARVLLTVYGIAAHGLDRVQASRVADASIRRLTDAGNFSPTADEVLDAFDEEASSWPS